MENKYYYLPLDSFGQPDGQVKEIHLTEEEFLAIKKDVFSPYYYIYKDELDAIRRAMD